MDELVDEEEVDDVVVVDDVVIDAPSLLFKRALHSSILIAP